MSTEQSQETLTAEVVHVETALATIVKAEIDMQISTAKAYPRSISNFLKKAETLATVSVEVAESCYYSLQRGDKKIEGPSIRFAEIVAATYGNIRVGARVIFNDGKKITAQGIAHDLESNVCATVEVTRSIMQHIWEPDPNRPGKRRKTGRMEPMNEDMQVVTGNAACAIAYRNVIFKVVPAAIAEAVYQKVRIVARGDAATLETRRQKAVEFFKGKGVKEEQIFAAIEVKDITEIDLDKLELLTGMKSALNNGESTIEELFAQPDGAKDKAKKATDKTATKLQKKPGANPLKETADQLATDKKADDGAGAASAS